MTTLKSGETPHDYRIQLLPRELALFKERRVDRILEVCCGDCRNLHALEGLGYRVAGLEQRRFLSDAQGLDVRVHPIFGKRFPYAQMRFDAVYSYQYINHNYKDEIERVFEEIHRVLKPGGIFSLKISDDAQFNLKHIRGDVYEEQDPEFPAIKFRKLAAQTYAKLSGDERGIPHYAFRKDELRASLKQAGFKVLGIRTIRWNLVANAIRE